ncbi:glycosyl hydrolase [Sedimentibacter sp.]|uniref:glycoside hydrolase family 26 protein n=1 Tax=Sedimentibacter sp. TaxID=1960295 RepID=UPI002897EE20|nr:glycosyl hydrolase [Sedimentibacter sp.]
MNLKKIFAAAISLLILSMSFAFAEENSTVLSQYSSGYNKYINNPYGYEIILLDSLVLNEDIISVKSRFESENVVVDILYDNFENSLDNINTYINYGNKGILKNPDFVVTREYDHNFKGTNGHITLFERRKLKGEEPDRNYYAMIAFPRNNKEVVTVFIKSAHPVYIDYIMPSFKLTGKTGTMKDDAVFKPVQKSFDEKTQEFFDEYFINNEKIDFGIFEPTYPTYDYRLKQLEQMFDYEFPVVLLYNSFVRPFKTDYMNLAKEQGKVVEYGLYTTDMVDGREVDITLDIIEGKYDDYLDNLARSFNEYDYPVLFRLNNEMNGEWVWYSAHLVGKDTDLFTECWKYIYDKFKEHGVDNLIFVWNPNEKAFPGYAYNHYLNYYPGDEYVDIVGITSYNTGNYYKGETWRSFAEAYDHFYYDYVEHFEHPMMITEFSCASLGGNKSEWLEDMFSRITGYDRIKLAVLWNGQDYDMTKPEMTVSRNYRIDQEQDVIDAVRRGLERLK